MKFSLFGRYERQAERMKRMMQCLDVDVVSLAENRLGRDLADARSACLWCNKTSICEAWLNGKAVDSNPYAFCPNGAMFHEHAHKAS